MSRGFAAAESITVLAPYLIEEVARRGGVASRRAQGDPEEAALRDLEHAISVADVVSFDLFDTLVTRLVRAPEDVHVIVARRAAAEGVPVPVEWSEIRQTAEEQVRASSDAPDIRMEEIYDACSAFVDEGVLARLQELELEIEAGLTVPTRRGARLFERARAAGRTVVVASDMYLPVGHLELTLRSCGFEGWDRLIVSGPHGVSKRDGSTYRLLRELYPRRSMVHIGDNPQTDVASARRAGIDAFLVESPLVRAERSIFSRIARTEGETRTPSAEQALSAGLFITRSERARLDGFAEVGYGVIGPSLLAFSHFVHRSAQRLGADVLYFLAREGRLLRRGYEASFDELSRLETRYALLSSRVTGMAALSSELQHRDMRFLTKTPVPLPAIAFLTRILGPGREAEFQASLRDLGIDPAQQLSQDQAFRLLKPVFEQWTSVLQSVALEQRRHLAQYLESIGLFDRSKGRCLVDVGWAGTIQRSLLTIGVPEPAGIYLGLLDVDTTRSTKGLIGWIDARRGAEEARQLRSVFDGLRVLEMLMAASDEGSTAGFAGAPGSEDAVEPIRLPLEFSKGAAMRIDRSQEEALRFIRDFRNIWEALRLGELHGVEQLGRADLAHLLERPTLRQLRAFARLPFDGSYGHRVGSVGVWGRPARLMHALGPRELTRRGRDLILPRPFAARQ